jgi:hypothetical protein
MRDDRVRAYLAALAGNAGREKDDSLKWRTFLMRGRPPHFVRSFAVGPPSYVTTLVSRLCFFSLYRSASRPMRRIRAAWD